MQRVLAVITLAILLLISVSVVSAQELAITVDGGYLVGTYKLEFVGLGAEDTDMNAMFGNAKLTIADSFGARLSLINFNLVESDINLTKVDLLGTYRLPLDGPVLEAFGGYSISDDEGATIKGFLLGVEGEKEYQIKGLFSDRPALE